MRRRSPDPGVVRAAAFVTPTPYARSSNCCAGSSRRGVKRAACSNRQKSLRGFAKCACAAAETRPGLMPQKSTRSFGPSTSGIADSGGFGLGEDCRVTRVEVLLEAAPQRLAFRDQHLPRTSRLQSEHVHGRVRDSVTPRVALCFAE